MKARKHPYIYISYSWDSDEHKEKVKNFVKALRLDNINVTYDEDLPFRERLPHYMEKAIIDSDIVLFICTPNYKYCADNRVSVVGTENQIITSELYETYNKNQFIPILFSGTWETSLPTWAKGKLGADLSTQELYKTNYQKLIQYLQNTTPNFRLVGATGKNIEERMLSSRTYVEINSLKSTIKTCWKKISDVNTFRGLVLVAVVSGVILSLFTPFFSSPDTPASDNSSISNTVASREKADPSPDTPMSDNSSFSNTIASGEHADNSVPNNEFIEDANTDDPTLNSNVSDNPTPSKVPYDEDVLNAIILEDLVSNLATNPANGTMPKGTAPITITLPNDMQEKLDSIQKLSIGSSKKWFDDKLGSPYAETVIGIIDDRQMYSNDDESSKTGELLVCAYNISDIIMVQAYFDISDNSCLAFFVTLLDDISGVDIMMPKFYSSLVSDKPLGEYAFSELGEYIVSTYGYAGQGIGRTFYGEEYYFGAAGNYNRFFFAVLDYGMLNSRADFSGFLSIIQFNIGPCDDTLPLPEVLNSEREKFYPNTYGISTLNSNLTFDLLGDYYWFDTLTLINQNYYN
ncbi:MAG: TIR domain-containing protein [Lachnospiraceae bacterium]|nr:TIR domain-containing protein [Lachnospiraceae bacterium]MCM1215658.1 TIR domain-containing protein [Lachnospiraceae bacterium]MCM1238472.1 TIR domain-containing protein [Lachnospiraceae bacterium]